MGKDDGGFLEVHMNLLYPVIAERLLRHLRFVFHFAWAGTRSALGGLQ
jgi:hypothetical protein